MAPHFPGTMRDEALRIARSTPLTIRGNPRDGYTAPMRRWLVLLMLAFLPLQFSWSAVAGYCDDEPPGTGAAHLGHHDHAPHGHGDAAWPAADPATDQAGQPAADLDCNHCHGQCTGVLAVFDASLPPVQADPPAAAQAGPAPARAPAPPERPQWPRLA